MLRRREFGWAGCALHSTCERFVKRDVLREGVSGIWIPERASERLHRCGVSYECIEVYGEAMMAASNRFRPFTRSGKGQL